MIHLAFRNILRNKRRSIITFISVFFASFLILSMRFLIYGSHQESLRNTLGPATGYIQAAAFGWIENKPLDRALDVDQKLLDSLMVAGVNTVSPRVEASALVSHESESAFASVTALNPKLEKNITNLHTYPIEGKFLHEIDPIPTKNDQNIQIYPCLIGRILANRLNVGLGGTLSLVSSQFDGTVGAILVQVKGIYKTLETEMDSSKVILPLEAGEILFGLGEVEGAPGLKRYTSLAFGLSDELNADPIYEKLSNIHPRPSLPQGEETEDSDNYSPVVHSWRELVPGLAQLLEFDAIQNEITLSFLILVMAFGVLNTVQMSIQERTREFGIMMAIGTGQARLIGMVLLETAMILFPGLLIGTLGGVALGMYYYHNPYILPQDLSEAYSSLGFPVVRIIMIVNLKEIWIGLLSLFLPSILLTLLAARRISKINPAQSIMVY